VRGLLFSLLLLYPKEFLPFLGLVGKGSFNPSQYGRSFASLRMTGYENHFCLWGKVGKGAKPSFQNVSLRADFARSLLL